MQEVPENTCKTLSGGAIRRRAKALVSSLAPISALEAVRILNAALAIAISVPASECDSIKGNIRPPDFRLVRRGRGGECKIDGDPEIKAYLVSIDRRTTLDDLRRKLIDKYGADRAPSRSALHRWIDKQTSTDEAR
jgi:hypothetical protein